MQKMMIDVIQRAAKAHSGMIEVSLPSDEANAAQKAKNEGYLDVIGNWVYQITMKGKSHALSLSKATCNEYDDQGDWHGMDSPSHLVKTHQIDMSALDVASNMERPRG